MNFFQDVIDRNSTLNQSPFFKAPVLNLSSAPKTMPASPLPPKTAAADVIPSPTAVPVPAPVTTSVPDNNTAMDSQKAYSMAIQHSIDLQNTIDATMTKLNKATDDEKKTFDQITNEQVQGIRQHYQATIDAVKKLQNSITAMPDHAPEMQNTQQNLGVIGSLLTSFMTIGATLAGGQYGGLRAASAYNGMVDAWGRNDIGNFKMAAMRFDEQMKLQREKNQQALDMYNSAIQGLLAGRNMDKEIAELEMKQAEFPVAQTAQQLNYLEKIQAHTDNMLMAQARLDKPTPAGLQRQMMDIGRRLRMNEPVTKEEKAVYDEYLSEKTATANIYNTTRENIANLPKPVANTPGLLYSPKEGYTVDVGDGKRIKLTSEQVKEANLEYKTQTPTNDIKVMVQSAPQVLALVDRADSLIDRQIEQLGPLKSRWAEFWSGKVGMPNPQFRQLMTDVDLLSTRLMKMHVGARGSVDMMKHFQNILAAGHQSPENLKAAINEIKDYANEIKDTPINDTSAFDDLISKYTGGRIKVKALNGRIGTIPKYQLNDALKQGYIQVR